jgi:hypothetical protein
MFSHVSNDRELQRLNNITKSPVLSHFSETLNGLPTIRAYGLVRYRLFILIAYFLFTQASEVVP